MLPQQRARYTQAVVLTASALVIVLTLAAVFGPIALLLAGIGLPVPLVLLWASADVLRADEAAVQPAAVRAAMRRDHPKIATSFPRQLPHSR
jgi:hypothetical protein